MKLLPLVVKLHAQECVENLWSSVYNFQRSQILTSFYLKQKVFIRSDDVGIKRVDF